MIDGIDVEVAIPPRRNRKVQRSYDIELYKERKLLKNFMGFVKLAAIAIWLR